MKIAAFAVSLLMLCTSAVAEIEKIVQTRCEAGICFYWWPKLPAVKGWHHELDPSYTYSANALAPDGSTFMDAESVMYANALYKPRMPETKSLERLIADDKQQFIEDTPGIVISEAKELITADGQKLRSFTFFPTQGGNWERVSYGEEGKFYLIFALSSRSKSGYDKAMSSYEALVRSYKEKL